MSNYIYLDLNVFDRLEKLERLAPEEAETYQYILDCLNSEQFETMYSNAHINDLIRAHNNSPSGDTTALEGHLNNLSSLTNNLCICQYWKEENVRIHNREVSEFFNSSLSESDKPMPTFTELMGSLSEGAEDVGLDPNTLKSIGDTTIGLFDYSIEDQIKEMMEHPILQKMFPKTAETKNMLSMLDDILSLHDRMVADPKFYREIKQLMNPQELLKLLPEDQKVNKQEIKKALKGFDFDAEMDKYAPKTKTSENPWYDKITDAYSRIDFKGFKSDKEFSNMMDDARHTCYGAYCSFFITNDDRCHYKATEVYRLLGIGTLVMKPKEFVDYMKSQMSSEEPY